MHDSTSEETRRVVEAAAEVSGDREAALRWLHEPLPAFGDQTPEALIAEGRSADLLRYLAALEAGPLG